MQLTIKDRYELRKYVGALSCTLALRYAIEEFNRQIDFTPDEMVNYGIKVDETTFEVMSSDDSYAIDVTSVPEAVVRSMKDYVNQYDVEQTKENPIIQKAIAAFRKVL